MSLEELLIAFGYIAFCLIIYSNGIISLSLNSSQLTLLVVGFLISTKNFFNPFYIIFLGIFFRTLGNFTSYEIIRKYGLTKKIRHILLLKRNVLKKLNKIFKKKGKSFIFIGKLIPSTHTITVILCGLSKTNRLTFNFLMILTNAIWILIFLYLGILFGKNIFDGILYFVIVAIVSFIFLYLIMKKTGIKKEDFMKD